MNEIYWITRLDLISGWLIVFAVVSAIVTFIAMKSTVKTKINDGLNLVQSYLKYHFPASLLSAYHQFLLQQQMKQCLFMVLELQSTM